MSDYPSETSELPSTWQKIYPDQVYRSDEGRLVSFSQAQIQLGILYDPIGKHLKAIHKGIVPPKGNTGLVPSQESGYDLKSKILGKGGDRRFHGRITEGILYFPGKITNH